MSYNSEKTVNFILNYIMTSFDNVNDFESSYLNGLGKDFGPKLYLPPSH